MVDLRIAYAEWQEDPGLQQRWIRWVLDELLGLRDAVTDATEADPSHHVAEHAVTLRPSYVVRDHTGDGAPAVLLVHRVEPGIALDRPTPGQAWVASPIDRAAELARASSVALALVTNGARWTLVWAREGETTGTCTWRTELAGDASFGASTGVFTRQAARRASRNSQTASASSNGGAPLGVKRPALSRGSRRRRAGGARWVAPVVQVTADVHGRPDSPVRDAVLRDVLVAWRTSARGRAPSGSAVAAIRRPEFTGCAEATSAPSMMRSDASGEGDRRATGGRLTGHRSAGGQ